ALEAASADFALGSVGAGTGATTAGLKGGLGSASLVLENGLTVGALVAVNAVGSATGPQGQFWASPWEMGDEFGGRGPITGFDPAADPNTKLTPRAATTIAIIATDAKLTQAQATRMAVAAHDGMARALVPSHTPHDGDLVFAAATGAKDLPDPLLDPMRLGHAAATCLARAIARGVYSASPAPNDLFPTWAAIYSPD
ncbi:MAG: P1 family peptidase, partial [Maritimibacter sp.]